VAGAEDGLVAPIAKRVVLRIATWSTQELCKWRKRLFAYSLEIVGWMMTVNIGLVAWNAEIVVWAIKASHEAAFFLLLDTANQSTSCSTRARPTIMSK